MRFEVTFLYRICVNNLCIAPRVLQGAFAFMVVPVVQQICAFGERLTSVCCALYSSRSCIQRYVSCISQLTRHNRAVAIIDEGTLPYLYSDLEASCRTKAFEGSKVP